MPIAPGLSRQALTQFATACAWVALAGCRAEPAPRPAAPPPAPPPPNRTAPVAPVAPVTAACCPVLELRQYTLKPGQRDVLIELFDRAFVETQEAEGMSVLGQFRDLDRPDRFVWLRGFPDMPGRARSLGAFYTGPAWKAHAREANATMIDSDNVLLLRPLRPDTAFSLAGRHRAPPGAAAPVPTRLVVAAIYSFDHPPPPDAITAFERDIAPRWAAAGATPLAALVTDPTPNNFPRLPVREGEHVLVAVWAFAGEAAHAPGLAELVELAGSGRDGGFAHQLVRPPDILRLSPTPRSLL